MNVYEMEVFLRGKCLPGDLLVGESKAEYLVRKLNEAYTLKADRDAQQKRADALAVENAGFKHALSVILEHVDVTDKGQSGVVAMIANDELFNSETPATSAALAEIKAQGVEKFVAKIAKQLREAGGERGYNLVDWCEYAEHLEDRGEKFAAELREAK